MCLNWNLTWKKYEYCTDCEEQYWLLMNVCTYSSDFGKTMFGTRWSSKNLFARDIGNFTPLAETKPKCTNMIAEHLHRKETLIPHIIIYHLGVEIQKQMIKVIVDWWIKYFCCCCFFKQSSILYTSVYTCHKILLNKVHAKYCLIVLDKQFLR